MEEVILRQGNEHQQHQDAKYASRKHNKKTDDKSEEKSQQEGVQGFFGKRR